MNPNYCGPGETVQLQQQQQQQQPGDNNDDDNNNNSNNNNNNNHNSHEQFECYAMAASSNSWLHQNLLSQPMSSQQQSSLFHHSELPLHVSSSPSVGPLQHMSLGHGMDSHPPLNHHGNMHSALHMPGDLQPPHPQHPHMPVQGTGNSSVSGSARALGPNENGDAASVRKVHKADREKLRRDRLNEQFVELAGVLDPDRPKNDKATILGDSVQVVKELRSDVKRLKCEQASLLDESRDLQQEKTELREEKAALKTETEQLQQRLRGMLPWISMDPTAALMGAAPYPYPMPVPQPQLLPAAAAAAAPPATTPLPTTTTTTATATATLTATELPTTQPVGPAPFLSLAPPGVYMHPYAVYSARPPEGSHPYMPYPAFPASVGNHSHIERPYAQYPSPISSMPGYLVQMQPPPQGSPNTAAMPIFRPPLLPQYSVPGGMTLVPPPGPARGSYPPHMHGPSSSPEPQGVETSLQLQTPGGLSRSAAAAVAAASEETPSQRSSQGNAESKTPEGADLELTPPGTKEASDLGLKPDDVRGGDSVSASLTLASQALLPGGASEESQPHETSLRPPPAE